MVWDQKGPNIPREIVGVPVSLISLRSLEKQRLYDIEGERQVSETDSGGICGAHTYAAQTDCRCLAAPGPMGQSRLGKQTRGALSSALGSTGRRV